jgi:outer membrane lipoprotein-sorting protein
LTRIKAISVVAAALMLTALGTVSALAWHGVVLSAAQDCNKRVVTVSADDTQGFFTENGSPHSGNLIVKDSSGTPASGTFTWSYDTTKAHAQPIGSIPLSALSAGKQYSISIEGATDVAAATVTYGTCKSPACSEQLAVVGTPTLSQDGKSLTWKVHNSTGADITFQWFIKEAGNHPAQKLAPAGKDVTVVSSVVSGSDTDTLVLTWGGTPCVMKQVFSASATPAPTESASPSAAASASPSESAAATTEPTSSAVPSPPNTGGGSGGGADRSFAFVLLALVLGTVGVGGTTLALSRKGS